MPLRYPRIVGKKPLKSTQNPYDSKHMPRTAQPYRTVATPARKNPEPCRESDISTCEQPLFLPKLCQCFENLGHPFLAWGRDSAGNYLPVLLSHEESQSRSWTNCERHSTKEHQLQAIQTCARKCVLRPAHLKWVTFNTYQRIKAVSRFPWQASPYQRRAAVPRM